MKVYECEDCGIRFTDEVLNEVSSDNDHCPACASTAIKEK